MTRDRLHLEQILFRIQCIERYVENDYEDLDVDEVWRVIAQNLPELKRQIEEILQERCRLS